MNPSSLQNSIASCDIESEKNQIDSLNTTQQLDQSNQKKPSRRKLLEEWKK